MRICLIASSQFPIREPFAGGLEAHTYALARALIDRGHDIALFAAAGSDPCLNAEILVPEQLEVSEAARQDVGAMPESWMQQHHAYLGLMLELADPRRSELHEFDIIHNNSLHHLPVALSTMVPAPLITTLHTPPTPWLESAAAYAAPSATFTAVSRATAHAWQHVVDADVIPNGVDTHRWQPGPEGADCVWSGRLVPEKAPHLAIDAARRAGMKIALAGAAHDRRYFDDEIRPRLDSDAVYYGHLTQCELQELVGSSGVAVVSSQWEEPYGLVAAEAMACGTPVAACPRGGLLEIVTPQTGSVALSDSADNLAAAILEAATKDRSAVRTHAEQNLSLERMVTGYEDAYRAALCARPAQNHVHAA